MKAFGKILGLFVLGLLLIIVALGFALTHFIDPNDYKDQIRKLARDKAHIELTLNGDIGWSLFPWLGLELHDASVATLTQPQSPLANLQLLGLSVRVLPLLRRELQMSDVRVDGLELNLRRDAQGHGNWEDLGKPLPGEAPQADAAKPSVDEQPSTPAERRPLKLDIDSLTLNNGQVNYLDEQSGRSFSAESIQLSTGAVHPATDIPVTLTAFLGTNQPELRARTELKGILRFDPSVQRYQFEDMRLGGELTGAPLEGQTLTFAAQGQLLADLDAKVADWNNLKVSANQFRALGDLHLRDLTGDPQLSGALSVAQLDLRAFLQGIGQPVPATADATALSQIELVTQLAGNRNALAMEDLTITLDGGTLKGRLAVDDIARQAVRIRLQGDKLDLDRYLPADSEQARGTTAARQAEVQSSQAGALADGNSPLPEAPGRQAWSDDRLFPIERLRAMDLQADLSLGRLTVQKLPIDNARLTANGSGGLLTLQTLSGQLADGEFNANGSLDVRPEAPLVNLQARLKRVPVEAVLAGRTANPPVRGLLTLDANVQGAGNSQKALIDTLNGNGYFALDNGVLVDANLEQQLCLGIAVLNRKALASEPRGRDTPFQRLEGSLTIRDGIANNPDLIASIPGLRVNGKGDLDLRVLGLDYRLGIVVEGESGNMADPACKVNDRFANLALPIRCRGPVELGARACRIDRDGIGQLAGQAVRSRLEEKLDDKLGDKVSPEIKDALRGLFKR